MTARAVEEIERVLERGGDADDVLRAAVAELVREPGLVWAGISFLEHGELVAGPQSGTPAGSGQRRVPIVFQGTRVGELAVEGAVDEGVLNRVALLLSAHVLLGWDTGGERWEP